MGIRKWQCSYCDLACGTKQHLTEHINIHTNVKPFTCKKCRLQFHQSGQLSSHLRVHRKKDVKLEIEETLKLTQILPENFKLPQKRSQVEDED